jgi:hypothetical protein
MKCIFADMLPFGFGEVKEILLEICLMLVLIMIHLSFFQINVSMLFCTVLSFIELDEYV